MLSPLVSTSQFIPQRLHQTRHLHLPPRRLNQTKNMQNHAFHPPKLRRLFININKNNHTSTLYFSHLSRHCCGGPWYNLPGSEWPFLSPMQPMQHKNMQQTSYAFYTISMLCRQVVLIQIWKLQKQWNKSKIMKSIEKPGTTCYIEYSDMQLCSIFYS